jgi:hypothetical protein
VQHRRGKVGTGVQWGSESLLVPQPAHSQLLQLPGLHRTLGGTSLSRALASGLTVQEAAASRSRM